MRFLLFVQFGPVELRLRLDADTLALPSRLDLSLTRTTRPEPRAKPRSRTSPAQRTPPAPQNAIPAPDHQSLVS
jgi:hypothetical protein